MTFRTAPVQIAGPSYQDRSKPLTQQETRNFYPEVVQEGKDQFVIKSFPGQNLLSAIAAGPDRGMHQMNEIAFRVVSTKLYSVDKNGNHTELGDIPGTERCIFAGDGVNLFVVASNIVSHYNGSTVVEVTNANILGAQSVAFINNQFLYTFPQLSVLSDVGDGASASSLNAINEESNPDDLVRDYVFDSVIYRMGTRSVASWYNSGVGKPPLDRIEGQTFNVGLAAKHSVANTRDFIYWLGSDRQIYRARGGQEQQVTSAAIAGQMQDYSLVSDAFAQTFVIDNKSFYMITFPSADATWVNIEELGDKGWFNLSAGIDEGAYNASSIVSVFGKNLVGDMTSGDLYTLDFDTYDQSGTPWQRRRVLGSINGDLVGAKGARIQMSRFELILETGVGLISGQGSDPRIMIEYSVDGGRTWDQGNWMEIGRLGEYNIRAEWWSLHSFYDMIIRITTTDPVPFNIYSGAIDVRLAGR